MQSELALELAAWLENLDCTMVEVCESCPDNPAWNIKPVPRKDFITALRAQQPAASGEPRP